MPDSHASNDARDAIIRRNGWAVSWLAVLFGVAMIWSHVESGQSRWSASAWHYALEVPGWPASWGAVILLAGVLMLFGQRHHSRPLFHTGCWIAFGWCCGITAATILAFVNDLFDNDPLNTVNPFSLILWVYIAYMYRERVQLSSKEARGETQT